MNKDTVTTLTKSVDAIAQTESESVVEFWYARDLMGNLGYDRWENFSKVIQKAAAASAPKAMPPFLEEIGRRS